MPTRYNPTVRDLINTLCAAIHNHPLIKNPPVYYPILNSDGSKEQIKIERYRTYDGIELIEPGLTLAVFPTYSIKTFSTSYPFPDASSVVFEEPYYLGPNTDGQIQNSNYGIIVALYYQDTAINNSIRVKYTTANKYTVVKDETQERYNEKYITREYTDDIVEFNELELEINPAEDILRDYMELLRVVLNDIRGVIPFNIRSSYIRSYDFPTTSWLRESTDVYFHMAYIRWDLGTYTPTSLYIPAPYIQSTIINTNTDI